ncbi:MAG: LysM peptidoglycan-binding domain-containing protein [Chloroflexi bacterium]|nr:LysM peptidoglycan-binding domain-containing protein [Chloroflexota bacterium]
MAKKPQSLLYSYRKKERGNKAILYFLLFIFFAAIIALILLWGFGKLNGKAWSFLATDTPTPTNTEVPTATPTMTPTVEPTEVPPTATIGPTATLDGPFTYVVQPDDFCYDIAIKFEVELEDLIYVNEWPEGQCIISVGQEIKVPPPWFTRPTSTPFPSDWTPGTLYEYHVQSGATLRSVAQYFNSTVERIVLETNRYRQKEGQTNFITLDSALQIGELLIVPVNLVTPTPTNTPTRTMTPTP